MYQAKSFTGGRGVPQQKFFFSQSEHVSSQIWCQKIVPLLGGEVPKKKKNCFSSLNMYQAISGVKNFPFTREGEVPSKKKIFPQSEHVSSQIWCQKIFPLLGGGVPWQKIFFSSLNMYQAKSGVKKFSLYWDQDPPPQQTHTCENITFRRTYLRGR